PPGVGVAPGSASSLVQAVNSVPAASSTKSDERKYDAVFFMTAGTSDLQRTALPGVASQKASAYNVDRIYKGILPCFFFGSFSTLFFSISRAAISLIRVSLGRITSSTNPRAAAS